MRWNLSSNNAAGEWPALPFEEWEQTCDTLHMWTQIVGKTRLTLTPLINHWWNVALYVTTCGLTTSPMPAGDRTVEVEFDFLKHQLALRTSDGSEAQIGLYARSVADFYEEYMARLRSLGVDVKIYKTPVEFDDTTPFDQDRHHASYDKEYVQRFHRILVNTDRVFKDFRARFLGKVSPVHFFWGSFDLAVTRFCGRRAELPTDVDSMTREAYSHEVNSCGFWPGNRQFKHAAFYAYTKPAPPELGKQRVKPEKAFWGEEMGEFFLKYDDVRTASDPAADILDFCQSTYEAGANLRGWDRRELER
jgi:hypothetical protein